MQEYATIILFRLIYFYLLCEISLENLFEVTFPLGAKKQTWNKAKAFYMLAASHTWVPKIHTPVLLRDRDATSAPTTASLKEEKEKEKKNTPLPKYLITMATGSF